MSVILYRLGSSLDSPLIDIPADGLSVAVAFNAISKEALEKIVCHHAQINVEYTILCSKIASEFACNKDTPEFREQMGVALKTAALLAIIYRDYLNVPREVFRLEKEQEALQQWLSPQSTVKSAATAPKIYVSKTIREMTSTANLPRLFAVRARRLLMAIVPLTDQLSTYRKTMRAVDRYAAPFFSHLSWLCFIPRLTNNLAMVIKHTIPYSAMSPQEKALGWKNRLNIQLQARWPELSNDLPWFIANLVSCFILTGPLLPYGIALSIGMQLYEVAQASMQCYVDLKNINQQRNEYVKLRDSKPHNSTEYNKINAYITHLDKRIQYDTKRLWIPIINTTVLLLAIVFAAPIFAPGFAVAGGVIAALITILSFAARKYIETQKPAGNLFQLLKSQPSETGKPSSIGLFAPEVQPSRAFTKNLPDHRCNPTTIRAKTV